MTTTPSPLVCSSCGRRFRWKPELAGRTLRCTCGQVLSTAASPVALSYHRPPRAGIDNTREFSMPLVFLCGGLVVECIAAIWSPARAARGYRFALALVGIQLAMATTLMLGGIYFASRQRGFAFGAFWTGLLKIAAIAVAPSALETLLDLPLGSIPLGFGLMIAWLGGFCLYFALIGAFFDLDQSDTWFCVVVIFLIRLALYVFAIYVL